MIYDSYVWKDRLRRERSAFRRKQRAAVKDPDRVDAALVAFEAFALLTGYIARKMIEAKKLSDELETATMEIVTYPANGRDLDFMNAHHVDRAYDFDTPRTETVKLRQLCNMLVHSFVFVPTTDDAGTTCNGFLINTDHTKDRKVYFIALPDFDLLVDEIVRDGIAAMRVDRGTQLVKKSRGDLDAPTMPIVLNVSSV